MAKVKISKKEKQPLNEIFCSKNCYRLEKAYVKLFDQLKLQDCMLSSLRESKQLQQFKITEYKDFYEQCEQGAREGFNDLECLTVAMSKVSSNLN